MVSGILHTLRNEEDLNPILKNGLRRGSNITIDSNLPNQSFTGDGITLMYDKSDIKFKSKGYNSNDGLVLKHHNYTPKAILIGADEFREGEYLEDSEIETLKIRKDYLDLNAAKIIQRLNKKLRFIKNKIDSLIYIEDIEHNGEILKFLYPKTKTGDHINALDMRGIKYNSMGDLRKIIMQHSYVFKDTDIPRLLSIYEKIEDKILDLSNEYDTFPDLEQVLKNRYGVDVGGLKTYINSLNLPTNIPIYYYISKNDGTAIIKQLSEQKMTQIQILKLLENMNERPLYDIISGDGYIYDTSLGEIHKFDGKMYGELLDGKELIKFNNGQMVKKSDFDRDRLVIHKHTKLYGEIGKIKEDGLVPMVFVKYYPNFNYKSGYVPQQVIERI